MDTPSWPTTSLPPLVAMVLQEPSRVDLLAALSEDEASGSAQWPLAPVGPAQATLDVFRHAAETLGYVVPETLCVQAGQLFYHNGRLEEVRLAGVCADARPGERLWRETPWSTPTPPRLQTGPDTMLRLDPAETSRSHFAALVVTDEGAPHGFLVTCTWAFRETVRDGTPREPLPAMLPKQPAVPTAFPDERGTIPANPLIAAGMAALWKGGAKARHLQGGWQASETGRPVYQHRGRKGGRILVYPHGAPSATAPHLPPETLWNLVEQLTPLTADVALAVLAQLCEPSMGRKPQAPLLEPVRITADAILQYKGIRRWGLERRLLHERVFTEMEHLRSLHFDVEKYPERHPTTGKWDPRGVSWQGDRLFDIVKVECYQESLFGDRERIEVSWLVRAGQWAHWWLNAHGRVWVGRMARILLDFDHREQRGAAVMAKKLGQRMVLLGEVLPVGTPITRRIDHILEDIGELPTPAKRDHNWIGRTRQRFDGGTDLLQNAGVLAVGWPMGYSTIPNRQWLETKIQLTVPETLPLLPPPSLQDISAPSPRPRRGRPPLLSAHVPPVDGATIRQTRLEHYWSQKTLATHLGISVSYLSQLENGTRPPSASLMAKILAWLHTPQSP